MDSGGVLVFGCSDTSANSGLQADKRTLAALQVPAATVSTGSASRDSEGRVEQVVGTAPTDLKSHIDDALRSIDCKVVKIGAIFSEESIKMASETLQQKGHNLMAVLDTEPFFKTGTAPKSEIVAALRRDVLPSTTLLSATVPEVMRLLEDAGVAADYPRGMSDLQALAKTVARELGPRYVVIKREFIDEDDGATTLHYVLGGAGEERPVMAQFRFENPRRMFGASYFIPSMIAAYLAKGHSVPEAVSAGFELVGDRLKKGELYQ